MTLTPESTLPQNLPDLVAQHAAPQYRCICGAVLRLTAGRLLDGAGQSSCSTGGAHSPRVAPSPMSGWLR